VQGELVILLGTRRLLRAFTLLTALAFVVLFVFSALTEQYFAWTIQPPATAAFLGAAYAAGCVLVILAVRAGTWAALRIPYLTIAVFAVLTLLATVLHIDRFHFGSPGLPARFAAWLWLAVYVLVPVLMVIMLVAQERRAGSDSDVTIAVPRFLAVALLGQGALLIVLGAVLYVVPATQSVLWPWQLTPLTARAIAAWLVAFGLGALLASRANDLARLEVSAWSYGLMAVLEFVVLVRNVGSVRWTSVATWGYLLLLSGVLATSVAGLVQVRARARTPSLR
jgi:hypothetical protein